MPALETPFDAAAYHRAYYRAHREALHARKQEWVRARQEWFKSLKTGPCVDCGRSFESCCMDFDHVRGEKVTGVGQMLTLSEDRIMAEIAKCDLVCACCHRIRTHGGRMPKGARALAFIEKINRLKDFPCIGCGGIFAPVAMDFDHVRGVKIKLVSAMYSYPWSRVLAEIAKCDLVCACCHRVRTRDRKQQTGRPKRAEDALCRP